MIITKQKNFEDLLCSLESGPVFLMGCSECATLCHTGGKDEIQAMKTALEKKNIQVTGCIVLDPACHLNNNKRMLKVYAKELALSKNILVLACGNGVQTVAELFPNTTVVAGTDTLFLGEISRVNEFDRRCMLCGDCIVDFFAGLCPISRCPKAMLNGPCGGSSGGKCEVDSALECVWDQMIQELKKKGNLQALRAIQQPKDWSKGLEMKRRV